MTRRLLPLMLLALPLSFALAEGEAEISVRVTSSESGKAMPCRITVVDATGELATLRADKSPTLAVRQGVVYTATGSARFHVPEGDYTLYATRGPEYSLESAKLHASAKTRPVVFTLHHQVDPGQYVSCDTHVHTLTFSGHGDATAEERMVTIAGEGLDVAVSTEHNRHVDYDAIARKTGTREWFTPITGNEVTTAVGHFNIFPVEATGTPPDYKGTDRAKILQGIRATPARVTILNHARDMHLAFRPADPSHFNPVSGESVDGAPWDFNAMEVINSGAQQTDWMQLYRDWFALLNHGHRITAVGSSDSHDVNKYIVGQGRTYVAVNEKRPGKVSANALCDGFLKGHTLVSCGLLTRMQVNGRFEPGDLATGLGDTVQAHVWVEAPDWMSVDRVELFADGQVIESRPILKRIGHGKAADVVFRIPRPKHDTWLVAIASGPGVTAPYWPLSRPYQPTRANWEPRMVGSTNPIRLDADGDGRYSSPIDYARAILKDCGGDPNRFVPALSTYDSAVSAQLASLYAKTGDLGSPAFRSALNDAAPDARQGIVAYLNWVGRIAN